MLFINHATDIKAEKDYLTQHLSRSDYTRDAPEIAGQWHGRAAELLELSGSLDQESYFRLCENINAATGETLTPRTKAERRVLYDFTFDVPKSVTLAYQLGGDERLIIDAVPQWFLDGHRKAPTGRKAGRPVGAKDSGPRKPYTRRANLPTLT